MQESDNMKDPIGIGLESLDSIEFNLLGRRLKQDREGGAAL